MIAIEDASYLPHVYQDVKQVSLSHGLTVESPLQLERLQSKRVLPIRIQIGTEERQRDG